MGVFAFTRIHQEAQNIQAGEAGLPEVTKCVLEKRVLDQEPEDPNIP